MLPIDPTPCQQNPNAFLQPGEDPRWASSPKARWAVQQCRTACPRLTACAADALAAGNVTDRAQTYPASGVIMAGVVCNGRLATRLALQAICHPTTPRLTLVETPGLCAGTCERQLVARDAEVVADGQVREQARGLCSGCYISAYRAGQLPPLSGTRHCGGPCRRPLTSRTRRDPGHVVHESGGWCSTCVRTRDRSAQAA